MTKMIGMKQAKMDFERLTEEIWHTKDRLLIEKDGLPIAVLLSVDDFEDIIETVGELSDPEYLASIEELLLEKHQRVMLKIIKKRSVVQETKAMFKAPPQILKEITESEELLEWGG